MSVVGIVALNILGASTGWTIGKIIGNQRHGADKVVAIIQVIGYAILLGYALATTT